MQRLVQSMCISILLGACAGNQPATLGVATGGAVKQPNATSARVIAEGPAVQPAPKSDAAEDLDEYHLRMLALAQVQFETFVQKAGQDPRFTDAVRRSRERIGDIKRTRAFVAAGLEERRKQRAGTERATVPVGP